MDSTVLSLLLGFIIYLFKKMLDRLWLIKSVTKKSSNQTEKETNNDKIKQSPKIKVGLLTNELPPIVYGGVSTWILNFMKMFRDNKDIDVIPIFLAHIDNPHHTFLKITQILELLAKIHLKRILRKKCQILKFVLTICGLQMIL